MKIYLEDLETEIEEKDCDINKGRIVCVGFNEKNEPTLVYQLFTKKEYKNKDYYIGLLSNKLDDVPYNKVEDSQKHLKKVRLQENYFLKQLRVRENMFLI